MKVLEVVDLPTPGAKVLRYARFRDERGYFTETARVADLAPQLGLPDDFRIEQINESRSAAGVIRGLHLQWQPWQAKLVRVLAGRLIDVLLDVRTGSPTSGCAVAVELTADADAGEDRWVWVPPGFAHGLVFDREPAVVEYLCSSAWSPDHEGSINIRSEAIDWSRCDGTLRIRIHDLLERDPAMAAKDREAMSLTDWQQGEHARHFRYRPDAPYGCERDG